MKRYDSLKYLKKSFLLSNFKSYTVFFNILFLFSCQSGNDITDFTEITEKPSIYPDYTNLVIPPNSCPLNFKITNKNREYKVNIYAKNGDKRIISSKNSVVNIPVRFWKQLLSNNKGKDIYFDIFYADDQNQWYKYPTITNQVANENIDPYLVYRKINHCVRWRFMGMYQRNIESFHEEQLIHSSNADNLCIHCHSFNKNNPNEFLFQIRSNKGTPIILVKNDTISSINVKSSISNSRAGITSWHPSNDLIAFTNNSFDIIYKNKSHRDVWDVYDKAADIIVYSLKQNAVLSSEYLSDPNIMEVHPEWSKDGAYLYYCRAKQTNNIDSAEQVKCDLARIAFDNEKLKFGTFETLIKADEIDGSISQLKFSPDGRYLLFNLGCHDDFPIDDKQSLLYVFDTKTNQYHKLFENESNSGSWHSWSLNGKWIVFSSLRLDGVYSKPFFCYFDSAGVAHKPFVLPQKDPEMNYKTIVLKTMPELITNPITLKSDDFYSFYEDFKMPNPVKTLGAEGKTNTLKQEAETDLYDQ